MPIDPMSGMPTPYTQDEMVDTPLPLRMAESLPGITAGIGFQAGRGARTIMAGGGFMDDARFGAGRKARRYGAFRSGSTALNATDLASGDQFLKFGRRSNRGARLAAAGGKQPLFFGARANTLTLRPRALRRNSSISVFSGGESTYTYAQGSRAFGKKRFGPLGKLANEVGAVEGENILGPGLLASVTAGRRMDLLERRAYAGSAGALAKLEGSTKGISRIASMNNPLLLAKGGTTPIALARTLGPTSATGAPLPGGVGSLPASERLRMARERIAISPTPIEEGLGKAVTGKGVGEVGVRGNLLASAMAGKGTRYMAGYFRGAQGFFDVAGLSGEAATGAQKAVSHLTSALAKTKYVGEAAGSTAAKVAAEKALKTGVFKELGFKGVAAALGTKGGAMALGARGFAMSLPGINMLATASLIYDLGKMGGEVIKSGVNLARDAEKSLQGSINKPLFGMGYRDTEAAATSRSRGVMAIQNSRLNARSALGSEAAMMAAHFG